MSIEDYRATFDVEKGYLNWAAFGPMSSTIAGEVKNDAELFSTGRKSSTEVVVAHTDEALDLVSRELDVPLEWMTHQPSTSFGLQQAIHAIPTGRVMASMAEWPSVTLPIARVSEAYGRIAPQWLKPSDGYVTPELVADALTPETTALVVSLVDFRTGYRADLNALRDVLGEDRLLIVDAVQAFGVVTADYAAADVVTGNGYKWLRCGPGTGWASFSDQARERLNPVLSGAAGLDDGPMFDVIGRPAAGARAFQVSRPDPLAAARLVTAMNEIAAVGVDVIEAEIGRRTAEIIAIADRYNIDTLTPRGMAQRGGIVSLVPRVGSAASLAAALANNDVAVTLRTGAVRVSAHVGTDDTTMRMFEEGVASFAQHASEALTDRS